MRDAAIALAGVAIVVSGALVIAPHLPLHPIATPAVIFVGAITTSFGGLFIASRSSIARVPAVALLVASLAILVVAAVLHSSSRALAVAIDVALVGASFVVGGAIGRRIEDPGHLLPAAVVAACADVVSVVSPEGPSHALASSEHALSVVAFSFPAMGTRELAPAIGVGDLVMVALFLAAARKHELPAGRVLLLAWLGAFASGVAAAVTELPIPALPAIGALVSVGVPRARTLRRKDRNVAVVAMGIAVVVAAVVLVRARFT